ncbi:MAG: hypothetical protein ACKO5C_07015 [Ferruginibacter sp.]
MKHMTQSLRLTTAAILFSVALFSCKKETPEANDEEVITTVLVKLTPVTGGNAVSFSYEDLDGPGGNNPVIQPISLQANKAYTASLLVLNKTVNPADTVSNEILAEADAHRFYYEPSAGSNINVAGLDTDGNGVPLGLNSVWNAGNAGTGTMKITLRHYPGTPPNKEASDPVNSTKSSTDIELTFNTTIQ